MVIVTVGARDVGANAATAAGSSATCGAAAHQGPPTGSLPSLEAPPRSCKPEFAGEAGAVERAFRALLSGYDRQDLAKVVALQTTPSRADDLTFMKTYRIRLYRINAITLHGNTAAIDYENAIVARDLESNVTTLLGQREVWTKQSGAWKFVADVATTPGIPRGMATVTVTLPDDAPITVPTLPNRQFAFLVKNTGSAAKGLFILGIPAHLDVPAFLPLVTKIGDARDHNIAAAFPHGVLEMGATPDIAANGTGTMVFSGRLPKGRYLLAARPGDGVDSTPNPKEYAVFTVR